MLLHCSVCNLLDYILSLVCQTFPRTRPVLVLVDATSILLHCSVCNLLDYILSLVCQTFPRTRPVLIYRNSEINQYIL